MKEHIVDLDDLTDSRELLYARPPVIMRIFIYLILAMLVIGLAWICLAEIDVVVKATGIIRPVEKISVIKNVVSGNVESVYYENGDIVKRDDLLYSVDSGPYAIEKESLDKDLDKNQKKLENLEMLEKSILHKRNFFEESQVEYYNRYLLYKYELENLQLDYLKKNNVYTKNKSLPEDSVSKLELEELRIEARNAEINKDKYISETLVNIKTDIENIENKIKEIKESLSVVNKNLDYCCIKAPISGKIQVLQDFNINDYIYEGLDVLRIVPENNNSLKVDIMVPNREIANISEGFKVQYRFLSLPFNDYGGLDGEVVNIPGDISSSGTTSDSIYVVEGSLDDTVLFDNKGDRAEIKVGMVCDARIVTRKKRILLYLLEQLDFIS